MPVGSSSSTMRALEIDSSPPEQPKTQDPIISKRELLRQGKYIQVNVLLPKKLYKQVKILELELDDDDVDRSDIVREALDEYLSKRLNKQSEYISI